LLKKQAMGTSVRVISAQTARGGALITTLNIWSGAMLAEAEAV
jgi:hypothetical protein